MDLPQEGSQGYRTIPLWAAGAQGCCADPLAERSGTCGAAPHLVGMEGIDAMRSKVESLLQESKQSLSFWEIPASEEEK